MLKIALCFLATLLIIAFIMPFFNFNESNINALHLAPSLEHFFGTDLLGRELFSRLFVALRNSFIIGILGSFLALSFALIFVLLSRLFFYNFWIRMLDMFLALPALLLMMFFASFMNGGFVMMIFIIALGHWSFMAKILESELTRIENLDFYKASIVLGSSKIKAFFKEALVVLKSLIFVLFVLNIVHSIATEATLSFFGLGLAFEIPSLGNILNDATKAIFIGAWWIVVFPVLALLALILPLLYLGTYLQKLWGVRT